MYALAGLQEHIEPEVLGPLTERTDEPHKYWGFPWQKVESFWVEDSEIGAWDQGYLSGSTQDGGSS